MTNKSVDIGEYDFSRVVKVTVDLPSVLHEMQKDSGVFDSILRRAKANEIIADSAFVEGLAALNQCLTPSHKLTSKKFSVWGLIARHLDLPTSQIIQSIDSTGAKELLKGFQFSKLGKQTPAYCYDHGQASKENAGEFSAAYIRKSKSTEPSKTSYLKITKSLSRWDQNIRFSIRALLANSGKPAYPLQIELLELIRKIISGLLSNRFNPSYTKHADYYGDGSQKSKKFDTEIKYCELCWRLSAWSAAFLKTSKIPLGKHGLTHRHCDIHDSRKPTSKYRADLRYKKSFEQEIRALKFPALEKSNFPGVFELTIGDTAILEYANQFDRQHNKRLNAAVIDELELRKAAYDLVHSRLLLNLHLDLAQRKSLAAQVLELKQKGLKQSEIARTLGKSRQEISRANKKLQSLFPNK